MARSAEIHYTEVIKQRKLENAPPIVFCLNHYTFNKQTIVWFEHEKTVALLEIAREFSKQKNETKRSELVIKG
jgi:hypothetical protein